MATDITRQRKYFSDAMNRLRAGDHAAAARLCEEALQHLPSDANIMCLAAKAYLASRRFDLAERHVAEALHHFPDFAVAHDVCGDLLLATGRPEEAALAYEKALGLDPARPTTLEKIDRARQLVPDPGSHRKFADEIRRAESLQRAGDVNQAEVIVRRILKENPDHVEAARMLASIASLNKRYREAEIFLRRATQLAPDYARAWVDLANAQKELEKYDDATASARHLLELDPNKAESHMVYAGVVGASGRHQEAIAAYRSALALSPNKAAAMCGMAHHLKTIGEQEEAVLQYRACIAAKPDFAEAFWSLANLKTFRFSNAEVDTMNELVRESDLPEESLCQIHNALGLEYEARHEYDRAFGHFERCNALRRKQESYDPVETEATYDRVIEFFDKKRIARTTAPPLEPTPIFIVGLPRSGSTLIEQILASHSRVEGTHELSDLSKVVRAYRSRKRDRFPESLSRLGPEGWARIGREYLERTEKHRLGAPFFIDKNPNNFIFVGLLKFAIPNARIINARRHPVDSCLGSYKQLFASGQPFTYDLTELAEYYLQYQRLMDYWHSLLPDFVLDVHYENVVADLETQVRRILVFCGLPFEPGCLRFHETERAIKTASSEQVRRPIYSSSVDLWRRYEPHLEELLQVLQPVLDPAATRIADDRP